MVRKYFLPTRTSSAENGYTSRSDSRAEQIADKLYTVYRCFSKRSRVRTRQGGSEADALLYYKEFIDLFRASGILKLPMYADTSSRADVSLAFVCSQMEVVDVLSKRKKGVAVDDTPDRATFLEFCEAVARVRLVCYRGCVFRWSGVGTFATSVETTGGFLPAFLGLWKRLWDNNRIISYDKAMTAKHAPYNKRTASLAQV